VTKGTIKDSGLGKAVGAVEKHKICKGTQNEIAISQRVQKIKEAWHARVKAQKIQDPTNEGSGTKRPAAAVDLSPNAAKKTKAATTTEEVKKVSSFSTLLKKVTSTPPSPVNGGKSLGPKTSLLKKSEGEGSTYAAKKRKSNLYYSAYFRDGVMLINFVELDKKAARRVKWADHFGGKISAAHDDENEDNDIPQIGDVNVSWSDRKKRDRLKEKELLSNAK
jgi:hypothetical protein